MTKLYENIKILCKEKGVSVSKVEDDLGFPRSTIPSWGRSNPSCNKVNDVAHYFHVTMDFLLGNTNERMPNCQTLHPSTIKIIVAAEEMKLSDKAATTIVEMMKIVSKLC